MKAVNRSNIRLDWAWYIFVQWIVKTSLRFSIFLVDREALKTVFSMPIERDFSESLHTILARKDVDSANSTKNIPGPNFWNEGFQQS